jgi:hypothetical protein
MGVMPVRTVAVRSITGAGGGEGVGSGAPPAGSGGPPARTMHSPVSCCSCAETEEISSVYHNFPLQI